jgi:hypothetical protein
MELVFSRIMGNDPPTPAKGELHLRPRVADTPGRRELAKLAVEQGVQAFVQGPGPIERIVVQADPTLDDMLAAAFVERLLANQPLPRGAYAFAEYAAVAREGLKPGELPLQESLDGIYLAIRNDAGDDLGPPEARQRFVGDWSRMSARILKAAEVGEDPLTSRLFAGDPAFTRARTFLTEDREVYVRQDVPRGEKWVVRLPGGPPKAAGLILRCPKSFLWKYWSREDPEAPGGHGYLFLGVDERPRHWRFSTNPAHRLPIGALAEELQKAEAARAPARAANDQWFDGKGFRHTLIGAPHSGTALSDEEVLRIVKRWTGARRYPPRPVRWKLPVAACLGALVIGAAIPYIPWPDRDRGLQLIISDAEAAQPAPARTGTDYALLIATDKYKHWPNLGHPLEDARAIKKELVTRYGFRAELLENPTQEQILLALRKYSTGIRYRDDDQLFFFFAGHGDFDDGTREGFVVAGDSLYKDLARVSYIPHSRIRDQLDKVPCKHIFLAMDICFGGTFEFGTATNAAFRGRKEVSRSEFIRRKMRYQTRRYLTSGGRVVVPDKSLFAEKLLEALRGGGTGGVLTLSQITLNLEKIDPEPRKGEFGHNDPDSDFLFVAKGQ